jgi:hypothetical protein
VQASFFIYTFDEAVLQLLPNFVPPGKRRCEEELQNAPFFFSEWPKLSWLRSHRVLSNP